MTPLEFEEMFVSEMWKWDMAAEGEVLPPVLESDKNAVNERLLQENAMAFLRGEPATRPCWGYELPDLTKGERQ